MAKRYAPFLGETSDRKKAFPDIKSATVAIKQDIYGHYSSTATERRYTLENIPRTARCVNPRCQQGGVDLQQLILFPPDKETTFRCDGHEGSPQGRRKGSPCLNWFVVTVDVEKDG
jgi:hypothetical protein